MWSSKWGLLYFTKAFLSWINTSVFWAPFVILINRNYIMCHYGFFNLFEEFKKKYKFPLLGLWMKNKAIYIKHIKSHMHPDPSVYLDTKWKMLLYIFCLNEGSIELAGFFFNLKSFILSKCLFKKAVYLIQFQGHQKPAWPKISLLMICHCIVCGSFFVSSTSAGIYS